MSSSLLTPSPESMVMMKLADLDETRTTNSKAKIKLKPMNSSSVQSKVGSPDNESPTVSNLESPTSKDLLTVDDKRRFNKARIDRLDDHQKTVQIIKTRHNKEILLFLQTTDKEEKNIKIQLNACNEQSERARLQSKYEGLGSKFQKEMGELMDRQREELTNLDAEVSVREVGDREIDESL